MSGPKSSSFRLAQQLAAAIRAHQESCAECKGAAEHLKNESEKATACLDEYKRRRLRETAEKNFEELLALSDTEMPEGYERIQSSAEFIQKKSGELQEEFFKLRDKLEREQKEIESFTGSVEKAAEISLIEVRAPDKTLDKAEILSKAKALLEEQFVLSGDKAEIRSYLDDINNSDRENFNLSQLDSLCRELIKKSVRNKELYAEYELSLARLNKELERDCRPAVSKETFGSLSENQLAALTESLSQEAQGRAERRYIADKISQCWNRIYPDCPINCCKRLERVSGTHYISKFADKMALDVFYESCDRESIMWRVVGLREGESSFAAGRDIDDSLSAQRMLCRIHPLLIKELEKEDIFLTQLSAPAPDAGFAVDYCDSEMAVSENTAAQKTERKQQKTEFKLNYNHNN